MKSAGRITNLIPLQTVTEPRRLMHSPTTLYAMRRRNRQTVAIPKDEDDDEGSPSTNRLGTMHTAVTDETEFADASKALIEKLYKAIEPMGRSNDPFFLTKGFEEEMGPFVLVDFGPVQGQYTIQVDRDQSLVSMTTPRSGQITYILSDSTHEWVSEADGHAMEGMLVRDMIHHAQGVPNL
jgi:hypothetical protein